MYVEKRVDTLQLTPELARQVSAMPTFVGDRDRESPKGRKRIAWLKSLADRGYFFSPCWSTVDYDGDTYRIDGGHSSAALTELNGTFPSGLVAVIRRFECDSPESLADLFSQFDNRRSLRTIMDKVKAHKSIESELDDIAPTYVGRAADGIAYCLSGCGEEAPRLDEDARISLIHTHGDFIQWARAYIGHRFLRRVGVVAAIYATYSVAPGPATEFWTLVRDESAPNRLDATRTLAKFLTESHGDHRRGGAAVPTRGFYVKSIHAWNAWRKGRTTMLKYHPKSPLPRPI